MSTNSTMLKQKSKISSFPFLYCLFICYYASKITIIFYLACHIWHIHAKISMDFQTAAFLLGKIVCFQCWAHINIDIANYCILPQQKIVVYCGFHGRWKGNIGNRSNYITHCVSISTQTNVKFTTLEVLFINFVFVLENEIIMMQNSDIYHCFTAIQSELQHHSIMDNFYLYVWMTDGRITDTDRHWRAVNFSAWTQGTVT